MREHRFAKENGGRSITLLTNRAWGWGAALKHFAKGYCHTDLGALGASGCIRELQQVLKSTSHSQRTCCSESKELKLLTAGHKPQLTPTNWHLWVKLQVWFYSDKLGSACEDVLLMHHNIILSGLAHTWAVADDIAVQWHIYKAHWETF